MRRRKEPTSKRPKTRGKRLRKQPRMRRVPASHAVTAPKQRVPRTAKKRRWRNRRSFKFPWTAVKNAIFSARWISLGILSLMIWSLYLVGMDTDFYLTMIPVEGTWSVPAAEIVSASGLAGSHVFAADPAQAAEQITAVPGVISATVTLSWPNQVLVQVGEETPVAVWQEAGVDYWIMENGRVAPARSGNLGLLRIESEVTRAAAAGVSAADEDADASAAAAGVTFVPPEVLAGALQLRELRPNIEKLYFRPSSGLSYQDGRGWRAYFGTGTDMAQKLVVYETIVADLLERGLSPSYISVSNQEKPYYLTN